MRIIIYDEDNKEVINEDCKFISASFITTDGVASSYQCWDASQMDCLKGYFVARQQIRTIEQRLDAIKLLKSEPAAWDSLCKQMDAELAKETHKTHKVMEFRGGTDEMC